MREELLSVGIDIGTSTTQLIFSKLIVENMASSYTVPRIVIVDKQIIYRSEIYFTPLISMTEIDGKQIKQIIEREYQKAGIQKEEIQTGAVIITGETARKENAEEVLRMMSGFAGDFVVAAAGPDLESIIAGKGAGADQYAKEHHTSVVNLDIGGGTTNLAVFSNGEIQETGCLDIGGRLIRISSDRRIDYIAPKLQMLLEHNQIPLQIHEQATKERLWPVVQCMVRILEASVGLRPQEKLFSMMVTNQTLALQTPIRHISFSGGVADAIFADSLPEDLFCYGDIGILLGQAIRESELCKQFPVIKGQETIRATVVGAGSHTTEISGSTICYTKDVFPIKNIPVLKLEESEEETKETLQQAIIKKLQWFTLEEQMQTVAIALNGKKNPSFLEVEQLADGILAGSKVLFQQKLPWIVVVEQDMAKVLGQTLQRKQQQKKELVCLDGIHLENGDYIDIGHPIAQGSVLPVVVKTLVFHETGGHR